MTQPPYDPNAGYGQSGYGQPDYSQPGYGQPQPGQPGPPQPNYGAPDQQAWQSPDQQAWQPQADPAGYPTGQPNAPYSGVPASGGGYPGGDPYAPPVDYQGQASGPGYPQSAPGYPQSGPPGYPPGGPGYQPGGPGYAPMGPGYPPPGGGSGGGNKGLLIGGLVGGGALILVVLVVIGVLVATSSSKDDQHSTNVASSAAPSSSSSAAPSDSSSPTAPGGEYTAPSTIADHVDWTPFEDAYGKPTVKPAENSSDIGDQKLLVAAQTFGDYSSDNALVSMAVSFYTSDGAASDGYDYHHDDEASSTAKDGTVKEASIGQKAYDYQTSSSGSSDDVVRVELYILDGNLLLKVSSMVTHGDQSSWSSDQIEKVRQVVEDAGRKTLTKLK